LDTTTTTPYSSGECWLDSQGKSLQAHGGGVLLHEGHYYWYGENRAGPVQILDGRKKVDAVGVSCYRSADLVTWEPLGVVLRASNDPVHDLHVRRVIERPKVIFNRRTGKFVMWLHVDSPDYKSACAGVAIADDPAGPFHYLGGVRPNGFESRDQTVFQDDDGRAYHVCASDNNQNTLISVLSDDYLKPTGEHAKFFPGRAMEAFALCKREGRYWMIASGCSGWKPNEARSASSNDMLKGWQEHGNPCVGENAKITFGGQSTFIIPPARAGHSFVAMFDHWRPNSLRDSGYVWLPIEFDDGRMTIRYRPTWQGLG
jgi:hypothetical protein